MQVDRGSSSGPVHYVVAKGAPEVVQDHLDEAPPGYAEVYKQYAAQGARWGPCPAEGAMCLHVPCSKQSS